ncbi:MAG: putative DNA polymerase [Prokaryotic dsDNA virus sp.]|nr:MAG: putative DNA polymerase [Prokaryotic dsDNA virus sp.]|tara:strand:- start:6902 stop:8869 length:1968 start_codon:yes stop_codon:yes gene_type:complete
MNELHIDFETFCVLDIRDVGHIRYTEHESCEVLMMSYAIDDQPTKISVDTRLDYPQMPADFKQAFENNFALIWAHNAGFEKAVIENVLVKLGWPVPNIERWRCSAAVAATLALPRSLDGFATAVKSPVNKDPRGKALIRKFCKPRKPTKNNPSTRITPSDEPDEFLEFQEYCIDDTNAERASVKKVKHFLMDDSELEIWRLDNTINNRGLPLDIETVRQFQRIVDVYTAKQVMIAEKMTGGISPTQRAKILEWVNDNSNVQLKNTQAATIDEYLEHPAISALVKRVLGIKKSVGRASVKKLVSMMVIASEDCRARGTLLYHGATTGRWSGQKLQPHNFSRPTIKNVPQILEVLKSGDLDFIEMFYADPLEAVSSCMRAMICAPEGKKLVVADYAAIEARGLCWLAREEEALEIFRTGEDIYKHMAAFIFNKPPSQVASAERQLGKQVILGCGYGMWVDTFVATCAGYGMDIGKDLAETAIRSYRKKYAKIVQLWADVEKAAKQAIKTGKVITLDRLKFKVKEGFLFIRLPSGRKLAYPKVRLITKKDKWGRDRENIAFYGKLGASMKWGTCTTYGGKLVENIIQALSRDLMANGMRAAESEGFPIIATVHDEIIAEKEDTFEDVEHFESLICTLPAWAEGMPLKAEGYIDRRYRK